MAREMNKIVVSVQQCQGVWVGKLNRSVFPESPNVLCEQEEGLKNKYIKQEQR